MKKALFPIVGIGASAGGLEAIQTLLSCIGDEIDQFSIVIVQHLSPKHRSMLAELLRRVTKVKVQEITNKLNIETNTIYIAPPNSNIEIKSNKFVLSTVPGEFIGPKPSIDLFLTSLAENRREKAIGVILSGTGRDGSAGMKIIKNLGGITIVQDPSDAKYDGMPNAAIEAGIVDLVLPAEQIASDLIRLAMHPGELLNTHLDLHPENSLTEIFKQLLLKTGCDFSIYKENTIDRRITRRLSVLRFKNIQDYLTFLKNNESEIELLYKDLLIGVTSFFRDNSSFDSLREHLTPRLQNLYQNKTFRAWVVACSTGEEAYTLSIMLHEILGKQNMLDSIQIFATDIDERAITIARRGLYPETEVSKLPAEIVEKYFIRKGAQYEIVRKIRESIVFSRHNILKDPPFLRLDLITCRNLLIYFKPEAQKNVLSKFYHSLSNGGLLFLGKSESPGESSPLFECIDSKAKLYEARAGLKRLVITPTLPQIKPEISIEISSQTQDALGKAKDAFWRYRAPQGVIIDENLNILHIIGSMEGFLQLAEGQASFNLTKMAHPTISLELRSLSYRLVKEKTYVVSSSIKLNNQIMKLYGIPLIRGSEKAALFLVIFETSTTEESVAASNGNMRENELVHEITVLREHLQTVIEELETANEELQATNEELQSSNEELQSSNEELETANEELQSSNEELQVAYNEMKELKRIAENEAATREASEKFADSMFEMSGAGICIADEFNIIVRTNSAFKAICGYEEKELIGQRLEFIFPHENTSLPQSNTNSAMQFIKNPATESIILHKDGSELWTYTTPGVMFIGEKPYKIMSSIDITEAKKLQIENNKKEELLIRQSRSAAMGEMISAIAHQWRQPLNALAIRVQDIPAAYRAHEVDENYVDDFKERSMSIIKKMSSTIDDFRNFFKPSKEKVEFSIEEAIAEALKIVEPMFKSASIEIKLTSSTEHYSFGYATEFEHVIMILLTNSKDALLKNKIKKPKITIFVDFNDFDNNLIVTLEDNAGGIPESIIDRVFDPYFTTKSQGEGTGIGLYMAREIVERQMQGSLKVSNTKKGAMFTMHIKSNSRM